MYKMGDLYVFECSVDDDKWEMIHKTKTCIEGALMAFNPWHNNTKPYTIHFPYVKFWVRLCGLPFEFICSQVGEVAGQLFWEPSYVDYELHIAPRMNYVRFHVLVNQGKPLIPGFFLKMDDSMLVWIQFKYENLFKYCTRCGFVGHKSSRCRKDENVVMNDIEPQFVGSVQREVPTMESEDVFHHVLTRTKSYSTHGEEHNKLSSPVS